MNKLPKEILAASATIARGLAHAIVGKTIASAAVSMAKAAADDCQSFVGRESIQTFGGIGFTWEHDCHLFVKRAATDGALLGGAAAHSLAVAATLGVGSG